MKIRCIFFTLFVALIVNANSFSKQPPPPDFVPPVLPKPVIKSFVVSSKITDPANTITDMTIEEVPTVYDENVQAYLDQVQLRNDKATIPGVSDLKDIITIIDDLIAIGKKIWPIIEKNRPVITTDLKSMVSVLPRLEGNRIEMDNMENWSVPVAKSYRLSLKNGFKSEVIGFTYTVIFQHSGTYEGVGKYITSGKIIANEIYASWGFNFDAKSELINIANVGTKKEPVASAIFSVSYKGKGLLNEIQGTQTFYVDGRGAFQVLK